MDKVLKYGSENQYKFIQGKFTSMGCLGTEHLIVFWGT